jgi:hypothetical protein
MSTPTSASTVRQDLIGDVLRYYKDHPGFHRPVDVAHALTETGAPTSTHQVATTSRRLFERNVVFRVRKAPEGWTRKMGMYGIPAPTSAPSTDEAPPVTPEE